jgi:glutamate/tyrosine decarboxylase-like PLP-dependent enzyme
MSDTKPSRQSPLEMDGNEFRNLGHDLVDRIADFLDSLPQRPVTHETTPKKLQQLLGDEKIPDQGKDPAQLLSETTDLLIENSLFNGHPRFWGNITASAAPIGALGDLLAAVVNPNVGAWDLSPIATEIETQTVRWIAELIGYPSECGGVLSSGGNVANFIGFLAGRADKAGWDVRTEGMHGGNSRQLRVYVSAETHTWVQKAADMFGLGTESIHWIPVDSNRRMDMSILRKQIEDDKKAGDHPFMVVGTGGSVSVGVVDDLSAIAALCREYDMWFHVDGAYGGFAASQFYGEGGANVPPELKALNEADSIAIDPHKWLYAPLEAGCTLVRDANKLRATFEYHPVYYLFGEEAINYLDYGLQNSRGFRALKIWLALKQVGRQGYVKMIGDDIRFSEEMYKLVSETDELEAFTQNLSICTFRFVPKGLDAGREKTDEYLDKLNETIVGRLQKDGEVFVSNAVIDDVFLLRACIVNFRTTLDDIKAMIEVVLRVGHEVGASIRPEDL